MRGARARSRVTKVPEISAVGLTCEMTDFSCVIAGAFMDSSWSRWSRCRRLKIQHQRLARQGTRHADLDVSLALLVGQDLVAVVGAAAHEADPAGAADPLPAKG